MGFKTDTGTVRPRPYDFRLKSLAVPKDGAWDLQTGDWGLRRVVSADNPVRLADRCRPTRQRRRTI